MTQNAPAQITQRTVIEFWEQDGADQQEVMDEFISEFEKSFRWVTVKRVHYETEELRSRFISSSADSTNPDVVLGPNDNLGVFVPAGLIVPIEKIVGEEYVKGFDPLALSCARFEGKQYMLPDRLGNELCLIINKKLVSKAPQSWDELVAEGFRLKKEGKVIYPLAFHMIEPFFSVPFLSAFNAPLFDDPLSPKAKPTLNTPQMLEWCRFMVRLQKENIIPSQCDYDGARQLFTQGKVPFIINGGWSFNDYIENSGMDILIAPIPAIKGKFPAPFCAVKGYSVSRSVLSDELKRKAVNLFVRHMTGKKIQLAMSRTHNELPSLSSAAADAAILSNPLMTGQRLQLEKSVPMPLIVQMRAVWDAMKPVQNDLFRGKIRAEEAPRLMQEIAEKNIRKMGLPSD
jgi:maltose-binding protein MalE